MANSYGDDTRRGGKTDPMRRFEAPPVDDLPDDLREHIEEETERAG